MGQGQSNLSNLDQDLKKTEDCCFEEKIILLIINPIYIINNDDFEKNLSTGDDILDELVDQRIKKLDKYLSNELSNAFKYETGTIEVNNHKIYLTLEKLNKLAFTINDCYQIREFFDNYNKSSKKLTILKENEAIQSPFYDDLGDIKLGFMIESIEYI